MRQSIKIVLKLFFVVFFLAITPFFDGLKNAIVTQLDLNQYLLIKDQPLVMKSSIKDAMNVLAYNDNLSIPKNDIKIETTQDYNQIVPKPIEDSTQKSIYIYNTHQSEKYSSGESVMDAGVILSKELEKSGLKVVLETNDFGAYAKSEGIGYEELYRVSYKFLNDALVNYKGFDLCIDLHRDSLPKNATTLSANSIDYAKTMMVIGGLGKNAEKTSLISATMFDILNSKVNGIMRTPMNKASYFNQEVHENIVLIELGAETNSFQEVSNTIPILAQGIADYLGR